MSKKKTPEVTVVDPAKTELLVTEVALTPVTLLDRIRTDIKTVATKTLVPVFSSVKSVAAELKIIQDKIRAEMLVRREEGTPYGSNQQHRRLTFGPAEVQIEADRKSVV